MKFRPCIDLHDGKVKQIVGKTLDSPDKKLEINFESDKQPSWFSKLYSSDKLSGGHVIMLGKGNEKAAKEALNSFKNGLQIGGGITDKNALEFLEYGASHVIITSFVFTDGKINWDNLNKVINLIGKDKLVLDLSCRIKNNEYYIVTDRWQKFTDVKIDKKNIEMLEKYCSEFLIHAVDIEGMMSGIDLKLIKLLSEITTIPVTYAGGISKIEELDIIYKESNGKIDFTIGSALDIFGGKLSYKSIVDWNNKHN